MEEEGKRSEVRGEHVQGVGKARLAGAQGPC